MEKGRRHTREDGERKIRVRTLGPRKREKGKKQADTRSVERARGPIITKGKFRFRGRGRSKALFSSPQ